MKKNLVLVAIIGLVISTLCGCGIKVKGADGIKVKGADGTEYESYQECCAANDYDAAHLFLTKMKNNISKIYESEDERAYEEAKEYVFKKEALFLMSQGDDAAKKRIIYLLKEEGGNDAHVSMLIDLAMENDDADFVNTLIKQYTREIEDEDIQKLFNFFVEKQDEGFVFKILTDIENKIPNRPTIGKVTLSSPYDYEDQCKAYSKAVKKYNDACRVILSSAIENHNDALAQKALSKIKSNINSLELPSKYVDNQWLYSYNTTIDNEDIKSAKTAYQEAVSNGAFK